MASPPARSLGDAHHHDRLPAYTLADKERTVDERLTASLVQSDRDQFLTALRSSCGGWVFYGAISALAIWLIEVAWAVGSMAAILVAGVLAVSMVQAAIPFMLDVLRLPGRLVSLRRRPGFGWYLLTTAVAAIDVSLYTVCFYLVAETAEWWGI